MRPQFEVTVQPDEFTTAASIAFDYTFNGISRFEGWEMPDVPQKFKVGLIIGPSGSGKSLLLSQFGKEEIPEWNANKAVVSHFISPQEAIDRLMSVGLNTIPAWCRPYHVLSNGEKFRADLARKIKTGAVLDEFTSVVDRNVAKAASVSLKRYIDNHDISNVVLASCHYDILEWLRPDWYFDTVDGILHDGRSLRRPSVEIKLYPCKRSIWAMFAKHHYLTEKLSRSCRSYVAVADFGSGEAIVGFSSTIPFPHGYIKNAYRGHRTVVLPDFQGLGFGPKISDAVAQLHLDEGKRYFSRTAHPRLGAYRDHSSLWKRTSNNRKVSRKTAYTKASKLQAWKIDSIRECFSHEYIGKKIEGGTYA